MQSLAHYLPRSLVGKTSQLKQLNQTILECLPTELIGHVHVAGLSQSILTLVTYSPVWASKLRYSADEIGRQMTQKTHKPINSVKITINPESAPIPTKKRKRPSISLKSANQIKALAETIDDPTLKTTLTKLSQRSSKKTAQG